jgi:surfeit locus 1 family protein
MRLPIWATFLTIIGVIILCTLGTWQMQRLAWKNDMERQLQAAYEVPHKDSLRTKDLSEKEYVYGRVRGRLQTDKAILLGARVKDEKAGAELIIPLLMKDGSTLLVDMGFASGELKKQPIHHLKNQKVWFEGITRKPSWNGFTPKNNPEKNVWYRADIDQIAEAKKLKKVVPYIFYAERASHKYDGAFPKNERFAPSNNHLQYAIFWYLMAAALVGVYYFRFVKKANR